MNHYLPCVVPNLLNGWDVYYHAYIIGAHKRTCVDHWNMLNHHTSVYLATEKYWNDLLEHIRKAKDIKKFKSLLKTHFLHYHFLHKNISQYHFQNAHNKISFVLHCRRYAYLKYGIKLN